eukprot:CAMPEP_0202695042 /NCGR_PEP_ID=MMETSP1385-20130828/8739_1 /ASSEMBLY_ACC=CAM_ASM_000861 /TAXON_ID=933848 /ORGANISM="Elphidium margaritaceum" /LENGTH=435 /DNA_ID=CAMNT_0049351001 /DNA_START=51 /DNA_END=1358 /DNA_ORIENTATION=+
MDVEYCSLDTFTAPYIELAISIPIFIILQLCLFAHTLSYEVKSYRKRNEIQQTRLAIRISFIFLQICGLYWTVVDLLRFVIDPYSQFLQNSKLLCGWAAYSPKCITILYFSVYLYQIMLRLELSFRGSSLAISRRLIIVLSFCLFIFVIVIPSAFFAVLNESNRPCKWRWAPVDFDLHRADFAVCDYYNDGWASLIIGIGVLWMVISNVVVGVVFGVKLKRIFGMSQGAKKERFALKSLIVKNAILTTTGSLSTVINWCIWLTVTPTTGNGIFLLYLDVWINCLVIALMFKYNEVHYKRCCRCCISCCFLDCDRTFNKADAPELQLQQKRIAKYLQSEPGSTIFSSTAGQQSLGSTSTLSNKMASVHQSEIELPTDLVLEASPSPAPPSSHANGNSKTKAVEDDDIGPHALSTTTTNEENVNAEELDGAESSVRL